MKRLKFAILALFALSAQAQAAETSDDATTVARLLVNNPQIGAQLITQCADRLASLDSTEIEAGVTRHVLSFNQSRRCSPTVAFVTITEDMRPTYYDGAPRYTAQVEFKSPLPRNE